MQRLPAIFGFFLISLVAAAQAGALERVRGTRVHLETLPGFVKANEFPGFINTGDRAMIIVSEMPNPYMELARGFNRPGLVRRQLELIERKALEKDGLAAEMLHVNQNVDGERFEKWIFLTGDHSESVVVTGSYPATLAARYRSAIERVLKESLWDSAQVLDHFDGLEFRIDDVPGLRIATRVSSNVIFTDSGRLPDRYYTGPLLLLAWNSSPLPEDRRRFSELKFRDNTLLDAPAVRELKPIHIGGLDGFEVTGVGKHQHLGYSVASLLLVLFDDDGYFIARGYSDNPRAEKNFALFRNIISSFRRQLEPS